MGMKFSMPKPASSHYESFVQTLPSMKGKRVAVTGTSAGSLGFIAALTAGKLGAELVLFNRQSERADEAVASLRAACPDTVVHSVPCDLQDFDSVREAAKIYIDTLSDSGPLDVLANNAGVMALPDKVTKDGYDVQMQTNHFSHFLLTSLLMPELERAAEINGEARVVNHSSGAHKKPNNPLKKEFLIQHKDGTLGGDGTMAKFSRYQQSKLANVLFTYGLKARLDQRGSKVKTLVAHPGLSSSNLQNTTAAAHGGSMAMLSAFVAVSTVQSAEDGSMSLLAAMCLPKAESGQFWGPQGKDHMVGETGVDTKLEKITTDEGAWDMLWDASEAAVGAPFFAAEGGRGPAEEKPRVSEKEVDDDDEHAKEAEEAEKAEQATK